MRNAFASEITDLAGRDSRIVVLMADIGNHLFDQYRLRFPDRFYNCGVAEANMIGVAAGLAASGFRPVCYTIAPFATTRCLEQIRVDLCYHGMPVLVVGTGAGLSYASLGATHHSCEDIAMLRVLPGIKVLCPGDAMEVRGCLRAALHERGAVYMRIGKKGEPVVHKAVPAVEIGECLVIKRGTSVGLLSAGNTLPMAIEAAERLELAGFSVEVVSFHTVKPLDHAYLRAGFERFEVVATIEEHSRLGGFGGSVAEWLSDQDPQPASLLRFGTADEFIHGAADQTYARELNGLTAERITDAIASHMRRRERASGVVSTR
jgi:transketolase